MSRFTDESTSRFADIDEAGLKLRLHFNDAGRGDPVIMLHGGGPGASGWSNYYRNIEAFVDAGFRVILPDFPGFGQSDALVTAESRALINARAIKGLMDVLGLERAHLVGNSLGGMSTLRFALAYPERLGRQILMGAAGLGQGVFQSQPMEGLKLLFGVYQEPSRENLERMLNVFVFEQAALTAELRAQRFANMSKRPEHLANMLKSFALHPSRGVEDLSPQLPQIAAQTLIVWGRDDRFVPLDTALKALWGLPRAELHVFARCGHWAQWEHAEAFNRLSIEFLRR